jgi:hypothetical protein
LPDGHEYPTHTGRKYRRAGFKAVEREEYIDYDERSIGQLAKRVKASGRKRLSELKRKR